MEDSVRLKADVVDLHTLEQPKLIIASMTRGTKVLRQFISTEPARIVDQFGARLFGVGRFDVWTSRPVAPFAPDAARHLSQIELSASDAPGRMTAKAVH